MAKIYSCFGFTETQAGKSVLAVISENTLNDFLHTFEIKRSNYIVYIEPILVFKNFYNSLALTTSIMLINQLQSIKIPLT